MNKFCSKLCSSARCRLAYSHYRWQQTSRHFELYDKDVACE